MDDVFCDAVFEGWVEANSEQASEPELLVTFEQSDRQWLGVVLNIKSLINTVLSLYDYAEGDGCDHNLISLIDELGEQLCLMPIEMSDGSRVLKF